jgi:hypothetical protein
MKKWDEKNYIGQKTNSLSSKEQEQSDITISIKRDSTQPLWKDIGEVRKWIRNCHECGVEILYTNEQNRKVAQRANRLCKMCLSKSKRLYQTPDKLERSCPDCGKNIEYTKGKDLSTRRHRWLRDTKENRVCNKCARGGKRNGAYGLHRFGKDNPNYGTKWTSEQKTKARKYWTKKFKERGYTINNYNPTACKYFDLISKEKNWNLRHAENGGEVIINGYFVDAYDEKRNIVVEYDEPHHFVGGKLSKKDIDRMEEIKQITGCKFYRYDERTKTLNEYN